VEVSVVYGWAKGDRGQDDSGAAATPDLFLWVNPDKVSEASLLLETGERVVAQLAYPRRTDLWPDLYPRPPGEVGAGLPATDPVHEFQRRHVASWRKLHRTPGWYFTASQTTVFKVRRLPRVGGEPCLCEPGDVRCHEDAGHWHEYAPADSRLSEFVHQPGRYSLKLRLAGFGPVRRFSSGIRPSWRLLTATKEGGPLSLGERPRWGLRERIEAFLCLSHLTAIPRQVIELIVEM